jgi:outer membrane protein
MKYLKSILLIALLFVNSLIHSQVKNYSLQDCIDMAFKQNVALNQTELTSKINEIILKQSKANLYPNLMFGDGQTESFGNTLNPYSGSYVSGSASSNSASLTSSFNLFNGFEGVNTINQNKYLYDAGNFDVETMKNTIILSAIDAYLQVLYSHEAVKVANYQLTIDSVQLDREQKLLAGGTAVELNVFQVESQMSADRVTVINAENQIILAKVALMQLMEMPATNDFDVVHYDLQEPVVEKLLTSTDIYKTAEGIRPEIKAASIRTNAAEIGLKIAQGLDYPKLTLGGELITGYSSLRSKITYVQDMQPIGYLSSNPLETVVGYSPTPQTSNYPAFDQFKDNLGQELTLNLTIPIFNNYQGKYGIEKARLNILNAKLNEDATKNTLRQSIEQAYTNLTASIKNYNAVKEALVTEQRTYNDMEKKFDNGLANVTDFLVEKNNLTKAQFAVVQAKYDYIFKTKVVDYYLGKPITL